MLKDRTSLHPITKRLYAFLVCTLLALIGIIGGGVLKPALGAVDVGANPTPKVDIAVSVPSDYPGTFLEFKQELTQKLIDQGMAPGSFRITDTATKIDTSNTEGWYVYDHYRDDTVYNNLNLSSEQKLKQPNRGSNNGGSHGSAVTIASQYNPSTGTLTPTSCQKFDRHIYNFTGEDGKANMIFAGYPDIDACDFMMYPAATDVRRSFSFDVDGSRIGAHTLSGAGFLMNAGIDSSGRLHGAYLWLGVSGTTIGSAAVYVMNPTDAKGLAAQPSASSTIATSPATLGSRNKARFTVELNKDNVTVQKQDYDASGNLGPVQTLFGGKLTLPVTGYNGFGPMVVYPSHGCPIFSQFSFLDLEMKYDSSAFDALKTTQYYEGAQQKYFINLAGDSNNPQIPDESDQTYSDGINRMNENEIFYLSNAQDGKIVRDTVTDSDGTHLGLGAENGYIAMTDDYVGEMADYIYTSFIEGKKFQQAPIASPLPLANFYMIDKTTGEQLMTVHQQHLVNTNQTVSVNFFDKSKPGQLAGENGSIAQWRFRVIDPDNNDVYDSNWVTNPATISDFVFTKESKHGKWIFELAVKDQLGNESKASQTYIAAFKDDKMPKIEGTNTSKNSATFTFTDTGQGIDDDGITFIEDNRGSGVAAYWITNDESATPSEIDWETFDEIAHTNSVEYELKDTLPVVVWVKDECGNVGAKTVFQPTRVIVQDPDGTPIDDYIVIGKKPIIVLPDEKDPDLNLDPDDPDDRFSGWVTPNGEPVTPGTDVPVPDDHTIVIRPSYAKDCANLIYLANGGQIVTEDKTGTSASFQVISGNSIQKKIEDQKVTPVREGYSFKGWKLVAGDTNKVVNNLVDIKAGTTTATGAQLVDPSDQVAKLFKEDESDETTPVKPENVKKNNYYLVAQWEIGNYTVRLDANGGSLGSVRSFSNVAFQTNIGTLELPVKGRVIPTKPGYIFQGWSEHKNALDDTSNIFKVAGGITGITPVAAPTMPARDKTIYAVWKEDKNQFVVHFDSDGGSRIGDQAYKTATATNYLDFATPTRPGYDFGAWYEVKDDGTLGETAYKGGEAVIKKAEHTFKATWIPCDDTKYTVDYYVNSGTVDRDGNAVYTKVNSLDDGTNPTKNYEGTTESTANVPESDKIAEITTGSKTYWYNPESSHVVTAEDGTQSTVNNNVLSGTITGSPKLSLKLYYDRFFDVNVVKDPSSTGEGTCTSATKQKEGTKPSVSWKAAEGSHVERVIVDGVVRDDLVAAGSYTVENPLKADVRVSVVFTKDAVDKPSGGQQPPVTDNTHFAIKTKVVGTTQENVLELTPTQSYKNHSDATVTWKLPENSRFTITSVTVDGVQVDATAGQVDFNDISSNHEVVVTVTGLPSMGGTEVTTADKYTLTVNRYGGDDKVITSSSMTVNEGTKVTPSWDATASEWQVVKVVVDNEDITSQLRNPQKVSNFSKGVFKTGFTANHVLDIYFALPEKDEEGNPVDPVIPDYTSDDYVNIKTKLIGAEGSVTGSITGGASVLKNSQNYPVNWGLQASVGDKNDLLLGALQEGDNGLYYATSEDGQLISPDDDNYVCYELEKVVVNGQEQAKTTDGRVLVATNEDKDVEVYVRPVRHTVTIEKFGEGTVSPSKSVYHLANYKNLNAQAGEGWYLAKVISNGETLYDAFEAGDVVLDPALAKAAYDGSSIFKAAPLYWLNSHGLAKRVSTELENVETDTSAADDAAVATKEADPMAKEPVLTEIPEVSTDANDSEATSSDEVSNAEATPAPAEDLTVTPEGAAPNTKQDQPLKRRAPGVPADTFDRSEMDQTKITEDRNVQVYFAKQATDEEGNPKTTEDGKPVVDPLPDKTYKVSATIVSGNGVVEGNALVEKGKDATLTITPDKGYSIKSVTDKAGNSYTVDKDGKIPFTNVTADHELIVELQRDSVSNPNTPIPGDIDVTPDTSFDITTLVQGGKGTISGAGTVAAGGNRTVSWKATQPEDPNEPQETVKYVYIDGVSHPELAGGTEGSYTFENVDKKHHVTVVFSSDPVNIDKDGDGKPDVNIDPDGDGDPEVNKDTDGDGEPDINKDTDDDGVPDTDVDTDDDDKPDVNKDTDGDGKPDVNIVDEDGDGKPDPVDPEKRPAPKPNVNVDTDDDGKPDLNVDTDDDGKPDINIVDKDGDGKPDPVDPKQQPAPEPDVNVDTDGDGEPDINIDTDGDGKPDKNIDTNGDRVYDWKDEGHPDHQDYLNSLKDSNGDGVYDWKDEEHPDHQSYLDSLKPKSDTSKVTPVVRGGMVATGDVSIISGIAGLLAAAAAATGGIALVGRKRRNGK